MAEILQDPMQGNQESKEGGDEEEETSEGQSLQSLAEACYTVADGHGPLNSPSIGGLLILLQ